MPVNWQDKAVQDCLLTAVIASVNNNITISEIARYCGADMSYHAVENYLRKFRRDARAMIGKDDATSGRVKSTASPKKTPSKDGIKSGRVHKNTPKNKMTTKVKEEVFENTVEDMHFGDALVDEEFESETEV